MQKAEKDLTSSASYTKDILGDDYEQMTIRQEDDYEGKVVCTLVRKKVANTSTKAVLYMHGFNDYFFQTEMADKFIRNGYDFYAVDLRKCGRSFLEHQKFNNLRDISEYYSDIDKSLEQIKVEGHTKVLLAGHSNGGLITTVYASDHPKSDLFNAIFLNSPFFDFHQNYFLRKLGVPVITALGKQYPNNIMKGGFSQFYGVSLHKSEKGEWDYSLSLKPHVAPFVNFGFIRAIHLSQKRVKNGININVPALIMHSDKTLYESKWSDKMFTGDLILNVDHIRINAQKIQGDVTIQSIKDGMHDLVLSPKSVREKVYENLFEWLKKI